MLLTLLLLELLQLQLLLRHIALRSVVLLEPSWQTESPAAVIDCLLLSALNLVQVNFFGHARNSVALYPRQFLLVQLGLVPLAHFFDTEVHKLTAAVQDLGLRML